MPCRSQQRMRCFKLTSGCMAKRCEYILPAAQATAQGFPAGIWPALQKIPYCEWNNNMWKGITSRPDVRFMPKKDAGTVDTMSEKDATATSNSTRMIRLRMVSNCMAHTSRVLSMFSTISCSETHENVKCGQNTVNNWWVDSICSNQLMSRQYVQCSHSKELSDKKVVWGLFSWWVIICLHMLQVEPVIDGLLRQDFGFWEFSKFRGQSKSLSRGSPWSLRFWHQTACLSGMSCCGQSSLQNVSLIMLTNTFSSI